MFKQGTKWVTVLIPVAAMLLLIISILIGIAVTGGANSITSYFNQHPIIWQGKLIYPPPYIPATITCHESLTAEKKHLLVEEIEQELNGRQTNDLRLIDWKEILNRVAYAARLDKPDVTYRNVGDSDTQLIAVQWCGDPIADDTYTPEYIVEGTGKVSLVSDLMPGLYLIEDMQWLGKGGVIIYGSLAYPMPVRQVQLIVQSDAVWAILYDSRTKSPIDQPLFASCRGQPYPGFAFEDGYKRMVVWHTELEADCTPIQSVYEWRDGTYELVKDTTFK